MKSVFILFFIDALGVCSWPLTVATPSSMQPFMCLARTSMTRIPEFTEHVLEYYEKWQNDELDMDKLKEDLWVYGGVRLEEVEGK